MPKKIKPLEPPDSFHLLAADGWLDLGDVVSANNELDEISPEMRAHPLVLVMRYNIYHTAEKWDMAAEIAKTLLKIIPDQASLWINYAYSTRRKSDGGIDQAMDILLEAEPKFPKVYIFPFNLACYESQRHRFKEAEQWLKKAMAINEKTGKKLAIDDPDLKPLWDSMGGSVWKLE